MVLRFFYGSWRFSKFDIETIWRVAQVVYDICFATDIKREVGNDGKVSYKVQYMKNNLIRPLFDKIKESYTIIVEDTINWTRN